MPPKVRGQLVCLSLCLPFQHPGERDVLELLACAEIHQPGTRLHVAQMLGHLLDQHRAMRIHRALIGIEAAHHAIVVRADHHRGQRVPAGSRDDRFVHLAELTVDLQRLRQHQRGLRLGRLQALQQALIVLRDQELIGAFRQHDIQTDHGRFGYRHRLQEFAEIRMP